MDELEKAPSLKDHFEAFPDPRVRLNIATSWWTFSSRLCAG
jgi:hypothetical protein